MNDDERKGFASRLRALDFAFKEAGDIGVLNLRVEVPDLGTADVTIVLSEEGQGVLFASKLVSTALAGPPETLSPRVLATLLRNADLVTSVHFLEGASSMYLASALRNANNISDEEIRLHIYACARTALSIEAALR